MSDANKKIQFAYAWARASLGLYSPSSVASVQLPLAIAACQVNQKLSFLSDCPTFNRIVEIDPIISCCPGASAAWSPSVPMRGRIGNKCV